MKPLCLVVSLILACAVPSHSFAQPTADELHLQADECLALAESSVLDFYLPNCIDPIHGGFYENLDANGQFATGGGKFLTLQARQVWTFSTFASRGIKEKECLQAAKHGFDFLVSRFRDSEHGGYYNQLHDDGTVKDSDKHAYLNSFVIYALVAYYRASGDMQALALATELFELLEEKAYDSIHGGYNEFFTREWSLISDPKQAGIVGAVGTKTYNTHLHLMESFAELYRASGDPRVGMRLSELTLINTVTVRHPTYACNIDGWNPDWTMIQTPSNLRASYGHDVECVWLVLDAGQALGWKESTFKSWAVSLVDYSLEHGYDAKHGGFFYTGPLGQSASDQHKEWWVQVEAMVCMLDMYRLTKDSKYYDAFCTTYAFVKQHQIAKEGGWWAARNADGSAAENRSRTSMWQGGYHNGRALLRCADLLHQLGDSH